MSSSKTSSNSPKATSANRIIANKNQQWRLFKDVLAKWGIALGGSGVIVAIVLIFFYLLYVVFPLFISAETHQLAQYQLSDSNNDKTLYLAMEEQNQIALRIAQSGTVDFFESKTGTTVLKQSVFSNILTTEKDTRITAFAAADVTTGGFIFGLSNGQAIIGQHAYDISYPNDQLKITPKVVYPMGEAAITIDDAHSLTQIAFQSSEEQTSIVSISDTGKLLLTVLAKEESLLEDEAAFTQTQIQLDQFSDTITDILLNKDQTDIYVISRAGQLSHYDISDVESPGLVERINVLQANSTIRSVTFLTGDLSLLIADSEGTVSQWFSINDKQNIRTLKLIRSFSLVNNSSSVIVAEQRRKGFVVADEKGWLSILHSTAERTVHETQISHAAIEQIALSPRSNALLLEDANNNIHFVEIDNEHPEVSWSTLWEKVWYESYSEPQYLWQSSSADNDFEPKLSLTPLVFGTLKAAFYAMLIAIPLSIMGAIYTAYFMAAGMRRIVKPSIETMEALPTVILGFLAGLWLAPLIEDSLPGAFSLLIFMPFGVLLFAFAWQALPDNIRNRIPSGWSAALLIPVVCFLAWLSFALSSPIESWLFNGDMSAWMSETFGVDYDQRNALIVGFAMGFAVIPTIFSITEDAVFSVPKHLSYGSLALGATPWQTLVGVVLLTASPGIFSAVMIGLGRAIGETMIVLMATGNTPVMDFSLFQGMRTLAANIAVEMPEAEVASTHYRVLFLAALVLFMVTFVFNTVAEIVRQRLRVKYSSL